MPSSVVTLIGDFIDSRSASDRQDLHNTIASALRSVSAQTPALTPLAITVGDEFQGSYARLGEVLTTVMAIRALLEPSVRVRFGVGRGDVTVLDSAANIQDGPGWWAARSAIEEVEASEDETGWSARRTVYRSAERGDPTQHAVNAALVCQDLVLDSFDERTWAILRGTDSGMTQQAIADQIGISRQAVQQRRASSGIPMLLSAAAHLSSLP